MVSEQLQSFSVSRLDGIMEEINRKRDLLISMMTEFIERKSASKEEQREFNSNMVEVVVNEEEELRISENWPTIEERKSEVEITVAELNNVLHPMCIESSIPQVGNNEIKLGCEEDKISVLTGIIEAKLAFEVEQQEEFEEVSVFPPSDIMSGAVSIGFINILLYDPIKSESQTNIITVSKLFPILGVVLEPAMQGRDMICRVRTGTGKTLAFDIPILYKIIRFIEKHGRGRNPLPVILTPTRELALQVENEFYESALNLNTLCIYGGMPISHQMDALKQGVDVVVGTPGRVIDLIKRGSLNLLEV